MDQFAYWRHKMLTTVVSEISLNKNMILPNAITIHFDMLTKLQKSVIEYKKLRSFNAAMLMDIMSSHLCSSIGHHLLTFGTLVDEEKPLLQRATFLMGFRYIREGCKDDSISNKLKCAHVLFRCGLFQTALNVLEQIEDSLAVQHAAVIPICCCRGMTKQSTKADVEIMLTHSLESVLGNVTAHCVYYLGTELQMAPSVLIYEMFRSFGHEIEVTDMRRKWMLHAAVDPVIMLFYLKYVCYLEIGDTENQETALSELCNTINEDPNLGHTETALNILGYCFMERGMYEEAFQCFRKSLFYDLAQDTDKFPISESKHHVKRLLEHNAAKIHLCVLVARVLQSHMSEQVDPS
jgi:tetratricopeptide (TPR) repeat protein